MWKRDENREAGVLYAVERKKIARLCCGYVEVCGAEVFFNAVERKSYVQRSSPLEFFLYCAEKKGIYIQRCFASKALKMQSRDLKKSRGPSKDKNGKIFERNLKKN